MILCSRWLKCWVLGMMVLVCLCLFVGWLCCLGMCCFDCVWLLLVLCWCCVWWGSEFVCDVCE